MGTSKGVETMLAKTFPIRTTDEWLERLAEAAKKEGKSMHQFVLDTMNAKIDEVVKN
jgi:predicted HicB family RNase H-like nuclease